MRLHCLVSYIEAADINESSMTECDYRDTKPPISSMTERDKVSSFIVKNNFLYKKF